MVAWPTALLTDAITGSYQETPEDNRLTFKPEVGRPKYRRRSSVRVDQISFDTIMTASELTDLVDFYTDDLEDGSLSATRPHPRTGASIEVLFAQPPTARGRSFDLYTVSIALLVLP